MVVVDTDKCSACGTCAKICHEHCMTLVNGTITIDYKFCSTCSQCIAVCPQQALSWDHVPPQVYERERLPSAEQLDELFKERRTIRDFKSEKIDPELLEEIVGYGIYAPTHDFNLRVVVLVEDRMIEMMDNILLRFITRLYKFIYRPKIICSLIRVLAPDRETDYLQAKPKLERALKRGVLFAARRLQSFSSLGTG